MKIGNQIRHRRTELNLSRGELANKIQVTPSQLQIMRMVLATQNRIFWLRS